MKLLDAGTSIGANMEEGQAGQSKPDFIAKNFISLKESRETRFWLRVIAATDPPLQKDLQPFLQEANEFVAMLTRALRLLVYVMVPIGALAAILSQQSVDLLFDYGNYDQAALTMTADALVFFLIGLAAHSLIAVLARAFYARQDTLTPVLAAVGAVVINTTLAIALVGPMGLDGIALAIAVAAWIEAIALVVVLDRRISIFRPAVLGRVGIESLVGTAVAAFLGYGALLLTQVWLGADPSKVGLIVQIAVTSAVFGAAYLAVSLVLRIPELPSIVGVMVDVLRRPRRT
jgi:putative peptidoglycan lipid II flippase